MESVASGFLVVALTPSGGSGAKVIGDELLWKVLLMVMAWRAPPCRHHQTLQVVQTSSRKSRLLAGAHGSPFNGRESSPPSG